MTSEFDDAYMFVRYANNLLAGYGLVWNPGEAPVNGVTSLLHLLVVTLLRAALPAVEPGRVLVFASVGAAALALASTVVACARATSGPWIGGRVWAWAAIVVPLLVATDAFRFHACTGMDTMLAAAANAAVVLAALWSARRGTIAAAVLAGVVGYVAYLARPDNAVVAVLVPLLFPSARRRGLASAATVIGLVALDLALRQWLLGTALPLSFHAKRPGAYGGYAGEYGWNPFLFLEVFLAAVAPFLFAIVALAGRPSWRAVAALLAPVAATFAVLFGVNQVMGHLGRFFFPAFPLVVVAAAIAVDRWLAHAAQAGAIAPALFAARVLAAVTLFAVGPHLLHAGARRFDARGQAQRLARLDGFDVPATEPLPPLDSWRAAHEIAELAAAAPAGTRVAMSEHGLPGALAPRAIVVDLLGLHDPAFARAFSPAALWARRPDLLWMPHPDHTQMVRDLLDSDELWREYDFYPDAFAFGVAVRKDSPAVRALLAARWRAVYPGAPQERHRARRTRDAAGSDNLR